MKKPLTIGYSNEAARNSGFESRLKGFPMDMNPWSFPYRNGSAENELARQERKRSWDLGWLEANKIEQDRETEEWKKKRGRND